MGSIKTKELYTAVPHSALDKLWTDRLSGLTLALMIDFLRRWQRKTWNGRRLVAGIPFHASLYNKRASRAQFAAARKRLVEGGYIAPVPSGKPGEPASYRWCLGNVYEPDPEAPNGFKIDTDHNPNCQGFNTGEGLENETERDCDSSPHNQYQGTNPTTKPEVDLPEAGIGEAGWQHAPKEVREATQRLTERWSATPEFVKRQRAERSDRVAEAEQRLRDRPHGLTPAEALHIKLIDTVANAGSIIAAAHLVSVAIKRPDLESALEDWMKAHGMLKTIEIVAEVVTDPSVKSVPAVLTYRLKKLGDARKSA